MSACVQILNVKTTSCAPTDQLKKWNVATTFGFLYDLPDHSYLF